MQLARYPLYTRNRSAVSLVASSRTRTAGRYKQKTRYYLEIPAFSLENTWKGASEILQRYLITSESDVVFSAKDLRVLKNTDFCVCVSYKISEGVRARFKLNSGRGELLYVDLYNGNVIPAGDFQLEVWSIDSELIENESAIKLYTNKYEETDCLCCGADSDILIDYDICSDVIFDLADFNPYNGDFYTVDGCDVSLTSSEILRYDYLLLQSDDETWHYVTLEKDGDIITFYVNPNNEDPGDTPYIIMRGSDGNDYKVSLELDGVQTIAITPDIGVGVASILMKLNTDYHEVSVQIDNGVKTLSANSIPYA